MSNNIFVENIKKWIVLDNNIKQINSSLKKIKTNKTSVEKDILDFASQYNLDNKIININNNKIVFSTSTTYPSISLKLLKEVLEETISDIKGVQVILDLLSKKREQLIKKNIQIKRK